MPCCCLHSLLCYLLPGCVTSTQSFVYGILTLTEGGREKFCTDLSALLGKLSYCVHNSPLNEKSRDAAPKIMCSLEYTASS